jgi:tRNA A-37 threonylcarbamoyl transferase component Bud32
MNDLDQHPEPGTLSAFGLGQLTGSDARGVERHLAVCAACRSTVDEAAADSFVTLLRVARRSEADPELRETVAEGSVAATPSPTIPPALARHSKYRVLELLGAGGMGTVYRAEHQLMERAVALKVIKRSLTDNPSMVERFRREVKAAARLTHPNIVTAYDADQVADTHFLVMEYVEGASLARLVAEKGRLPVAQACDCVRQTALGMQHAFEKGMVHRDIKPQNLMLTPDGQVKILDFGLARFAMETTPAGALLAEAPSEGDSLTQVGTVVGTPDYIAPEQARDAHTADIRADIYSLGCTLYDLLAGEAPFPEGTAVQKVLAHLERTPRPLRELRADVPPGLVRVIDRMMAKDPDRRYQTPAEVAQAVAPFLTQPRRPSRRLVGWMVGAAALLLLVGGALMLLRTALPQFPTAGEPHPYHVRPERPPEPPAPMIPIKWDKPSRPVLALDTSGHTAPVVAALFTPDGAHLITASQDNTVRIWDVAGGESLRVLRPPVGPDNTGRPPPPPFRPTDRYSPSAGTRPRSRTRPVESSTSSLSHSGGSNTSCRPRGPADCGRWRSRRRGIISPPPPPTRSSSGT